MPAEYSRLQCSEEVGMMPIITRRGSPARQLRGSASAYRVALRVAWDALRLASPQWPAPADASATTRPTTRRRATSFRDLQPKAFEDRPAHANLLESRARKRRGRSGVAITLATTRGMGMRLGDGSDGRGLSGSAVTVAPHNTCFTRRGASRRWPPRAGWSASVKGGGHAFAALSVGSRRFVKH
jgi:hypothetical protein